MPTISNTEFTAAVQNGWDNQNMEVALPGGDTTGPTAQQYTSPLGVTRSGSEVLEGPTPSWQADNGFTIDEVDFALEIGADYTSFLKYTTGDGPLDQFAEKGASITVTDYGIDMQQPGMAEILLKGNNNLTIAYRLLDGNDNVLASKTESGGPNWSVGSTLFQADSDLTFTNGSGGSWTVGGIEVLVNGSGNRILKESISTSVGDGGSITFTTLEVSLTLP